MAKSFSSKRANVGDKRALPQAQRQNVIALRIFDRVFARDAREVRFAAAERVIKINAAFVHETFDNDFSRERRPLCLVISAHEFSC